MTFSLDVSILELNPNTRPDEEVKMPIVRVDFWEGVGEGKVKTMIRGITDVMAGIGVPEHAVEVIVYEIPKTHWGVGGQPCSERFKDVQPPG
jgi:4-oxalocrotonate tautomerase